MINNLSHRKIEQILLFEIYAYTIQISYSAENNNQSILLDININWKR